MWLIENVHKFEFKWQGIPHLHKCVACFSPVARKPLSLVEAIKFLNLLLTPSRPASHLISLLALCLLFSHQMHSKAGMTHEIPYVMGLRHPSLSHAV